MRRLPLIALTSLTFFSTTVYAEESLVAPAAPAASATPVASPFGAPSKPLTAQELKAIKREAEAHRRARAEAARKAKEAREAKEAPKADIQQEDVSAPVPVAPTKSKPVTEKIDPYAAPVPEVSVSEPEILPDVAPAAQQDVPVENRSDMLPPDTSQPAMPDVEMPKPELLESFPDVQPELNSHKKP